MNIVVCDDEQVHIDALSSILHEIFVAKKLPLTITAFTSGKQCVRHLLNYHTDLVFLDIFLADSMGTDIAMDLRLANRDFKLIFLTNSNEFAAESFQAKASYYLLKPPTYDSIWQALHSAQVFVQDTPLYIDTGKEIMQLVPGMIIAIEVSGKYCSVYTVNGCIKKYCAFKKFTEQLTQPFFTQANRNVLINFNYVDKIEEDRFIMKNGLHVLIKTRGNKSIRDQYIQWLFTNS